jgi:hypothetical protein
MYVLYAFSSVSWYTTPWSRVFSCNSYCEFIISWWKVWLPLWSTCQSSCLQIQRSQRYKISREVVGLERGPLSLVSTTEELLERTNSGSGLEIREYGRRDPSRWPRGTLYPQKLTLTSPTSGVRLVGIVRSWTQTTEKDSPCPCNVWYSDVQWTVFMSLFQNWSLYSRCISWIFCNPSMHYAYQVYHHFVITVYISHLMMAQEGRNM